MNGWTLYFIIVGVTWTVAQFMRFVVWLDTPRKGRK